MALEELRVEVDALKQQLRHADAANAELIADKAVLLAQLAAQGSELQSLRPAVTAPLAPLDRDEILDAVFSYVGIRDYIYTGAVSRRWNGRYKKLCHNLLGKWGPKLCTNHSNTLISAGRLQIAIDSGLDMARLQSLSDDSFIMRVSLDPIAVLMQARQYGLDWTSDLSESAAAYNKLELLQWLQQMGCPLDIPALMKIAVDHQFIDILNWLRSNTAAA
eukprot:21586-Heterococcus_DN1.PRE.1